MFKKVIPYGDDGKEAWEVEKKSHAFNCSKELLTEKDWNSLRFLDKKNNRNRTHKEIADKAVVPLRKERIATSTFGNLDSYLLPAIVLDIVPEDVLTQSLYRFDTAYHRRHL